MTLHHETNDHRSGPSHGPVPHCRTPQGITRSHVAAFHGTDPASSFSVIATDRTPRMWHPLGTVGDRHLGCFEAPKHHIGLPSCVLGVERPPDVPISPPICERSTRVRRDSSVNVMYLLDCDKCWIFNLAPNEDAFDGLSAATNACSDTSRHMCHVSATCRKYGVERTLLDAALAPCDRIDGGVCALPVQYLPQRHTLLDKSDLIT